MNFEIKHKETIEKIVGIGGCGIKIMEELIPSKPEIEYIAIDTDIDTLLASSAKKKILLSEDLTSKEIIELHNAFNCKKIAFISCIGGDFSQNLTCEINKLMHNTKPSVQVYNFLILPHEFEKEKLKKAYITLKYIECFAQKIILIKNDSIILPKKEKIFEIIYDNRILQEEKLKEYKEHYDKMNAFISSSIANICTMIQGDHEGIPHYNNIDDENIENINTLLFSKKVCVCGIGYGSENKRVEKACSQAISMYKSLIKKDTTDCLCFLLHSDDSLTVHEIMESNKYVTNSFSAEMPSFACQFFDNKNEESLIVTVLGNGELL